MNLAYEEQLSTVLSQNDLIQILNYINRCLNCPNEIEFKNLLLSFSAFMGFEFVLYCYANESYRNQHAVQFVNLSNPEKWVTEYDRNEFLRHDPVRYEVERVLSTGAKSSFILWDDYTWELSPLQQLVIERRKYYGLNSGFSVFIDSENHDFIFLFSFASKKTLVNLRVEVLCKILAPHLLVTRKRLGVQVLTATLSSKENLVATWLMDGKTNGEIAGILDVAMNTVKFHMKNIFSKLQVTNRQQAIAVLLAERYLSI